ncbi:hypothetical protein DSM104299_01733 [Baekduia alba]|uniref:hypothetical protein n=1 Tax=Baekduia alba TaxID=2997333 RepID=UPI0023425CA5|nr:hypothetical protein [Baekduia alba]WCB93031.1 hypothetical protein DSM104299_01733 [Baekduia alba]
MRVRPLRPTDRRPPRTERRPHVFGRPAEAEVEAEVEVVSAEVVEDHAAERRHRECVTSEDTAHYSCSCGFQFQAAVTTSVSCPHCGTDQAW